MLELEKRPNWNSAQRSVAYGIDDEWPPAVVSLPLAYGFFVSGAPIYLKL